MLSHHQVGISYSHFIDGRAEAYNFFTGLCYFAVLLKQVSIFKTQSFIIVCFILFYYVFCKCSLEFSVLLHEARVLDVDI